MMHGSPLQNPGFDSTGKKEPASGMKGRKLKRRGRGRNRKGKANKITPVPESLSHELEEAAESLNQLASYVEEEINIFHSRFQIKHPSDRLYQEAYEEYFRRLAWYYRRISLGLPRQDLDTLERCFDSVRRCRQVIPRLEILLVESRDESPMIQAVKQHAMAFINEQGDPGGFMESLKQARNYVDNLALENHQEFDKIPDTEKSDPVIDAYNKIERFFGDFRRGLDKLERFLDEKSPGDLSRGLLEIRLARDSIEEMLSQ